MHVARTATVILIALFIAVPALHIFRNDKLGNPPPQFELGLRLGPQISLLTPTSAQIDFETLVLTESTLVLTADSIPERRLRAPTSQRVHHFVLSDLEPGTRYSYRIEQDGVLSARGHAFTTPPDDVDAAVVFAAIGDTGSGSARQLALIDQIAVQKPELVLINGDLAYPKGREVEVYARFTIPWSRIHDSTPLLVTLGNHDVKTDGGSPALDAIRLPTNPVTNDETYYESIHRSVRFISVNVEVEITPETPQYKWLEETLSRKPTAWTIVFGHRAMHPGSRSGGDARLREHLAPLLERHGVDIYLSGHDHAYMRTFPLRGSDPVDKDQEPDYHKPGAPIHVVSGGGGKSLYPVYAQPHLAKAISKDHFVLFDVSPSKLSASVLDANGKELDHFSISK